MGRHRISLLTNMRRKNRDVGMRMIPSNDSCCDPRFNRHSVLKQIQEKETCAHLKVVKKVAFNVGDPLTDPSETNLWETPLPSSDN